MLSRISIALFAAALLTQTVVAAGPADAWKDPAAFEAAVRSLPVELLPAIRFQRIYFRLSGSAPQLTEAAADLQKLTAPAATDHVAKTVAELSRLWLARIQMEEIDGVLRDYYREHVRFPDSFDVIKAKLPKALQTDPWGEPWAYELTSPKGFTALAGQRYQLGPKRYPNTRRLAAAIKGEFKPDWQAVLSRSGDRRVLSVRSAKDAASAVIEPGGTFQGYTLLYLGENWALIATPDRLTAIQL